MNAREFYELVVRMRAAQKLAGVTVKYEDIQLAFDYENKVDASRLLAYGRDVTLTIK